MGHARPWYAGAVWRFIPPLLFYLFIPNQFLSQARRALEGAIAFKEESIHV